MMNFRHLRRFGIICGATAAILHALTPSARANVYATDVKVNGGFTNIAVSAGTGATVSYILNEPATLGVTVNILLGGQSIRTLTVPAGGLGASRGTNSVVWDGLDLNSNMPPGGVYSISITAAASGFTNWTQTSVDANLGNYVYSGTGIAVDRNTDSPYYGRVFVSSSEINEQGTNVGDGEGILKLNADGSPADESPTNWLSTGGHDWNSGSGQSPWKLAVSADDYVYVDDLQDGGWIYRWDPIISTNSELLVLSSDNQASQVNALSGPGLFGSGTNIEIWMADWHPFSGFITSLGLLRFNVTTNGTCASNYTGVVVVAPSSSGDETNLNEAPYAVALDPSHNLYTIQTIDPGSGDFSDSVLRFPSYNPATNGGAPEITATWSVGSGDNSYTGASGVAVDSTGNYVAVGFAPNSTQSFLTNGNVRVFSAATGALLSDLDLDTNAVTHDDPDCAWDAVGNVYFIRTPPPFDTTSAGFWRVMSPPGTNQATTVAVAAIQVIGAPVVQPQITGITESNGTVTITFIAATNASPSQFSVQGAASLGGPYTPVAATITSVGSGVFQAVLAADGSAQFYQVNISESASVVPQITGIRISGANAVISFTGASTDYASLFTLQGAGSVGGTFTNITGASVTQSSPGVFRFTTPANAPSQFYRIAR